jgi:hypothetical protein
MPDTKTCLNCACSEMDIPLVSLRYQGNATWICSQCLPQLIHQPQRLAGKLLGAGSFPGVPTDEDCA